MEQERKVWNSSLKRKKGLERRTTLKRSQFERGKPPKDKRFFEHGSHSTPKRKTGLKAVSKKHRKALTKRYFPASRTFLKLRENRFCWICIAKSLNATRAEVREIMLLPHDECTAMLQRSQARCSPTTEIHHYAGRFGRLLDFTPFFVPSCRDCREWPHTCLKDARALDLLASPVDYNVFPRAREEELWEEYEKNSSIQSKK